MCKDQNGVDPFLMAWGEASAWREAARKSQMLSLMSQNLIEWNPQAAVCMAHAVGSAQSLRDFLVHEIDIITPSLHKPYLHHALTSFRRGQWGPAFWRRLWINRAMFFHATFVSQEFHDLSVSRMRLEAWIRSLNHAVLGVRQAQTVMDAQTPPAEYQKEWSVLQGHMIESMDALTMLRHRVEHMISGVNSLLAKSSLFSEACQSTPIHEDVLKSPNFSGLTKRLLAVSISGLPISKE